MGRKAGPPRAALALLCLMLGTGLGRDALADVLAQVASVTDEQASARDLSLDTSVLGWVIDVLAEDPQRPATVAASSRRARRPRRP